MSSWRTGQPANGKTTLANEMIKELRKEAHALKVIKLDGDDLRLINKNKDYSKDGRIKNISTAISIARFLANKNYLIIIKFHDLMAKDLIDQYQEIANKFTNVLYIKERNIIKYLLIADLMISDTSSVVYEFLLLDKPVVTYKNYNKIIHCENY